jgi:hypothetical protein
MRECWQPSEKYMLFARIAYNRSEEFVRGLAIAYDT